MSCFTSNNLIEASAKEGIKFTMFRHERGAIMAADGYSRTSQRKRFGVNVTQGGPVLIDTHDSIVYNDAGAEEIAVSVVGMDNVVVVVSRDGILVSPKDRAQDVRHAVAELKARGAKQV